MKIKNTNLFYILVIAGIFFSINNFSQAVTISPTPIVVDQSITIIIDANSTTVCNGFTTPPTKVYMHAGIGTDANAWGYSVVGNWGQDDGVGQMINIGGGKWALTIKPKTYFNLTDIQAATATKMGLVFRNANGTQEFKDKVNGKCDDFFFNVGAFQLNLAEPLENSTTILPSGQNLDISASTIGGAALFELYANGNLINSQSDISTYNFTHTNITVNTFYQLIATKGSDVKTKTFNVILPHETQSATLPSGLEDGINYNTSDPTKATLVLTAPLKDYVYVSGSFNNWQPTTTHAMKKDPTTGKYWLELTGLTSGEIYTYQYWVFETAPLTNSPELVKTADPCSTLVLSPYDDPWIPASAYPNLPVYPSGQEREVTVLQTGQTPYNWQIPNFTKPKKEDLVVYEVLVRDFDANRTYQDLIGRMDYFKNLNVNAIELMPVMEFEGNESWGYNTVYHMALDKFYGSKDKLKEFIDVCHQNGIAVILDIAFNHAFGRNPMVRMWMLDTDNDGWDNGVSTENPYFNTVAKHTYSVGLDFNHSSAYTKAYVKRVVKYWIDEFKIDGFRWDLTKGFTQNCTVSDEACTNAYQPDRVAVLKEYADFSWSVDPDHYVIFEHLGTDTEEKAWADYRLGEGKGIMLWGEMTWAYRQLTMGWNSSANITRMGHTSRGFTGKRLLGYPESHDKERLMYDNITSGNSSNTAHNVKNLNTALYRMSALGASSILVPGPKMIWHFADLGMQNSIYTCSDGSVNTESDAISGDCKLSTKPQPQWAQNWLGIAERKKIYDDWSRMIALKINEPVFEGNYTIDSNDTNLKPRIYVWDDALPSTQLKNVVILTNFEVTSQSIVPNFPYTGTWYNLMDNTSINVTGTANPITIEAGGFRIYGNKQTTLSNETHLIEDIQIYPNPARDFMLISKPVDSVRIFDLNGRLVKEYVGNGNLTYSLEGLKPAFYVVKLQKQNAVYVQKLIVE